MRYVNLIALSGSLFLSGILANPSTGRYGNTQVQNPAQEKAASLRSQLSEVEAKQAELQTRLQQLEENLKSENIERSLAGVGSTRPEDLREQRRRQLEIERNGVKAQLDILARSHSRLETAIAQADAEAYRQSAAPTPVVTTTPTGASPGGPSSEATSEVTAPAKPQRVRKKKKKKTKRAHHVQLSTFSTNNFLTPEE
jgi:DNA repair exonuclease SbcCD ATPase subunit